MKTLKNAYIKALGGMPLYNTIQCLMWSLHLAMVSMRPAEMAFLEIKYNLSDVQISLLQGYKSSIYDKNLPPGK